MILDSCDLRFQATKIRHCQKKGGQVHSYLLLGAQLSNFLLSSGGGRSGMKGAGLSHQGHQELDVRLWGRAGGYGNQAGLVLEDRPPPCGKHSHGCCSCQEAQTSPECKWVGRALSACAPTLELRGRRGVRSALVSLRLRFQAKLHASSSSLHHPLLPPSHYSPSPLRLPGQPQPRPAGSQLSWGKVPKPI